MKNYSFIIAAIAVLLFSACKKHYKDVQDYYPKVKTTGIQKNADGSVTVTGEITYDGAGPISYQGFCMDTMQNPDIKSNQQLIVIDDGEVAEKVFTCTYKNLDKNHKYYFKAFAANEYGYAIAADQVTIDSVVIDIPTVPCKLPLDTLIYENQIRVQKQKYLSKEPLTQGTLDWVTTVRTNDHSIELEFRGKPQNGAYSITESPNEKGEVRVLIDNALITGSGKIYVTEINNTTVEITICGITFYDGLLNSTVSTSFRTTY